MQGGGKEKSASRKIDSRRRYGNREFDAVRRKDFNPLSPMTDLQRLATESVAFCRGRLEAELSSQVRGKPGGETRGEAAPYTTIPKWYGTDRQTLRAAIAFLTRIIGEFEQHPVLREEWKEKLKSLDEEFFSDLSEWVPANWQAVLLAHHLARHAETFTRPLPEIVQNKDKVVIRDPKQGKQMVGKLLREKLRHLQDLARIVDLKVSAVKRLNSSPAGSELDSYKATMHELQRAVLWLRYLQRRGL